jgi:steroid delta-isomerase-like uncharacterized protein
MTNQRVLTLARRLELEVWGGGQLDVLDEIASPGYTVHDVGLGRTIVGRDAVREDMAWFRETFAIESVTIEDAIASNDRVAIRWTMKGEHAVEYEGVSPTGRDIETRGIDLFRVEDGVLVEAWVISNDLDLLEQVKS